MIFLLVALLGSSVIHAQSTGTIVTWGEIDYGQCDVPTPNTDFVEIDGGGLQRE